MKKIFKTINSEISELEAGYIIDWPNKNLRYIAMFRKRR